MKIDSILSIFDERTVFVIIARVLEKIKADNIDPLSCSLQYLVNAVRETFPEIEERWKHKEFVIDKAIDENIRYFKELTQGTNGI